MNCTCCKGSGIQKCTVHEFGSGKQDETFEFDCIWCGGSGKMTQEQAEEHERAKNIWCKCKNRSGYYFKQRRGTVDTLCADCDKALVIG